MKKNIAISISILVIFWIINGLTIILYKKLNLYLSVPNYWIMLSPFVFLAWFHGTKGIFRKLSLEYRLPFLRTLIWIPVVLLDIVIQFDSKNLIAEFPSYFLFTNNEILLPISTLPVMTNNIIESFFLKSVILYVDTIVIFGLLEIFIIKIAKKVTTLIVEK